MHADLATLHIPSLLSKPKMCIMIFAALIGLFLFYGDYVIGQYALAMNDPQQGVMVVALGWEMVSLLWPVFVAAMLLASAVSFLIIRWWPGRKNG